MVLIIAQSAIGGVIAEPRCMRVERIECRQVQLSDASCSSINHQPISFLPHPVWQLARAFFVRKIIVEAECAANDEEAIGYIVRVSGGEFLQLRVHIER